VPLAGVKPAHPANGNQIGQLLAQIFTINAWNRIGVSTHLVPGVNNPGRSA